MPKTTVLNRVLYESETTDTETISGGTDTGEDCNSDTREPNESTALISGLLASIDNMETSIIHMTRSTTARLDLFTTPPPKIISLAEDCQLSHEDLLHELRSVRQQLFSTYQALGRALGQLSASNVHCTSVQHELDDIRQRLDDPMKTKKRGSKKIKSRFLTSKNFRREFDREEEDHKEQERVAAEKQNDAENPERARRVAEDSLNRNFTGRLASYKKDDLRSLAIAISLSDKGTNNQLQSRIEARFKAYPDLQKNSRFSGLFNKVPRSQKTHPNTAEEANVMDSTRHSSEKSSCEGGDKDHRSPSPPAAAIPATHPHPPPIPTRQLPIIAPQAIPTPQPIYAPYPVANPHTTAFPGHFYNPHPQPYLQYPPTNYNFYSFHNPGP